MLRWRVVLHSYGGTFSAIARMASSAGARPKAARCSNQVAKPYGGPHLVDHSGHLHLLRPFPFSPGESRPDRPRRESGNRATDGDAPRRRTRSRPSGQILTLLLDHSL